MKLLQKTIQRIVKIRSSDPALKSTVWVLTIGPGGVLMRRFGERESEQFGLSWRSIISHALMHRGRFNVKTEEGPK